MTRIIDKINRDKLADQGYDRIIYTTVNRA